MAKPDDVKHILDVIVDTAQAFLDHDIGIKVATSEQAILTGCRFKLKSFTALMNISGSFNMSICFSFDELLIDQIYRVYCQELDFCEDDRLLHIDETAADMINIVVGNSTALLAEDGTLVNISVPIVINKAELLAVHDAELITTTLFTGLGEMMITVMPTVTRKC